MPEQRSPRRGPLLPQRRSLTLSVLFAGVTVLGLGAAVTLNWPTASAVGANPDDPAQVSLGRGIYAEHCATCHGANLEGQPDWRTRKADSKLPAPPHDETGHTWHHPDEQLFRITEHGVKPPLVPEGYESDMPAFGETLTDEQVWAVLAFNKSTWSPEIRARQSHRSSGAKR